MKSFKEFMTENGAHAKSLGGDGGAQNQYGRWGQEPVHLGVHRIEDPNVMQRLNAHVGLINTREYIDPRSALEHVQNALMRLGYHFEYNMNEIPNEQNVYPLNRFGGRKGFLDMDAVVKEDDGIEQAAGESMVLRVEFVQDADTARYEVFAQIVPASLFDEEDVQPEAIRPNRAGVPSTTGDADGINMGESIKITMQTPTTFWKASVVFDESDDKGIITFADKAELKDWDPTVFETLKGVTVEVTLPGRSKSAALSDIKKLIPRSSFSESIKIEEYLGEAVSISDGKAKGQGTFEVTFDFRGGPTQKQAQKFALAAQKRLAGASFTPNRKGNSETVVVTVKASSPRDAQVKARNVLDGVKESVDHITEAQKFIVTFPTKTHRNKALADTQKLPAGLRVNASALFPGAGPANGVFFSVSDNGTQTRDLMKLIKKNKGTVSSSKVESVFNESLSRTFAFPSADARDRVEKLLGLASRERVTTSDKGSGKLKFTVTAMLRGPQIDKIMNSVKQLKGIVSTPTSESTFSEMSERLRIDQQRVQPQQAVDEAAELSRTFAFPTSDARDRIEKLFGLATGNRATTSDKGKGKFKFTVTGMLKGAQIDKIMNAVKQLKGKLAEETSTDMANNAVREAIRERAERLQERDPFGLNRLKVARDTLKMNSVFRKVMGGPSKKEAIKILLDIGTPADKKLAKKMKVLGEDTEKRSTKAKATLAKATKRLTPKQQVAMKLMREDDKQKFRLGQRGTGPKRGTGAEKTKRSELRRDRLLQKFVDKRDTNEDRDLSHDENDKENRRTKKDNKLASVVSEATKLFTVVAIKNNKVVGQIHSIEHREIKTAVKVLKTDHSGAKVSVENASGKVVSVEATDPIVSRVKEQISKRKKTTSY